LISLDKYYFICINQTSNLWEIIKIYNFFIIDMIDQTVKGGGAGAGYDGKCCAIFDNFYCRLMFLIDGFLCHFILMS
jgi:hypothetical protein